MEKETCSICGKEVRGLKLHMRNSHPETLEQPVLPPETPSPLPSPEDILATFGLDAKFLEPMIAKAVNDTLGAMKLPELIQEVVPKAVEKHITAMVEQQKAGQPAGQSQSSPLQQTVIEALLRKIGGGDGGGGLEPLIKQMEVFGKIGEMYNRPFADAELRASKRLTSQLELLRKAGATPEEARNIVIAEGKAEE